MIKIEEKLNEVYSYVANFIENNGYSPTIRDICRDLKIKSTASAYYYLDKLNKRGLINMQSDKKRTLNLSEKSVPAIKVPLIGTVTAGTPILAVENIDGYYPLPTDFNSENDLFMLKVEGNSMINAGILDGDKIIVKKQESADNGNIVVALIDDSATVKRFYKKNNKIILHPENDFMSDIVLDSANIVGVVVGLMRKF